MRQLISILCLSTALTDASAQVMNVTFEEWVRFGQIPRAAYLGGVLDYAYYSEGDSALEWGECLGAINRTLVQTADDLALYPTKSQRTYSNVPDALRDYVLHLCPEVR
jgi:hypothetical protein